MTVEFDPTLERPDIVSMRLKAEGSELRVAVVLTRADGSAFEDVVFIPPADIHAAAKGWIENYCAEKMKEKWRGC